MVLFGVAQIIMSFIPDLHNLEWVSVVAAIMSFTYSFIGLGLGIATVISKTHQSIVVFLYYLKSSDWKTTLITSKKLY